MPQLDAPTLIEAIRTIYGPVSIPTPSSNVEMAVNAPEVEEVSFTLVTNQKCKGKGKIPSPLSGTPPDFKNKTLLVSRAPSLSKAVTACLAAMTFKTVQAQIVPPPVPLASKLSPRPNYLLRL